MFNEYFFKLLMPILIWFTITFPIAFYIFRKVIAKDNPSASKKSLRLASMGFSTLFSGMTAVAFSTTSHQLPLRIALSIPVFLMSVMLVSLSRKDKLNNK